MTLLVIALRFLHIVAGALWVGGVVSVALFLLPAIAAAGPSGPAVMKQLVQVRRMPAQLLGLGVVTIIAGLLLFWIDWRNSLGAFSRTPFGMAIQAGAALAIVAAVIGGFVSKPTADRLGRLGAQVQARGGPPSEAEAADLARLQGKLTRAARAVAILVVLAVALMAVARYL